MRTYAQEPFYRFKQLTHEHGLSQGTVTSIAQDERGFLWFGTMDGLNRFDGYNFKTYFNDPDDAESLSDNRIMALLVDSESVLWVGTLEGGLNRFDWKTERFKKYPIEDKSTNHSEPRLALSMVQDQEGFLWVGSKGGVYQLNSNTEHWKSYLFNSGEDTYVSSILEDKKGRIWVASLGMGIQIIDQENSFFSSVQPITKETREIHSIFEDSLGRIWAGSDNGGLFLFNPERDRLEPYDLPCQRVNSIVEDDMGSLWIGSQNEGVFRISPLGKYRNFRHDATLSQSLAEDQVLSLFQDRSSVLWIGLDNGGVNAFRNTSFLHYRKRVNQPFSLSHDHIWSLYEDRSGDLWVGTSDGLNRFNRDQETIKHYRATPDSGGISSNKVRAILEDHAGILWFGTQDRGLERYDPKNDSFSNFVRNPEDATSLSSNVITTLFEDHLNQLWVGTENGLNKKGQDGFIRIPKMMEAPDLGLPSSYVYALNEDHQKRLWIGTMGGGLSLMDREASRFRHFRPSRAGNRGTNTITSIWVDDHQDFLWLGSYGGGLLRFTPETGSFKAWRKKDGLPSEVIYGVLGDASGALWMSTNMGIIRFEIAKEKFRTFGPSDGVQGLEFNKGAYFKSTRGDLFFGGIQGFNSFRPEHVTLDQTQPELVLTDFRLFNRSVYLKDKDPTSPLTQVIDASDHITLSHDMSMITFEFAGLHYANPINNNYAYTLENYDTSWIEATANNRRATYTNLDAGDYRFKVRASNKDGVWTKNELTLDVRVLPPLWLTWWAKTIYIVLIILAFLIYFRSSQIKLTRERRISEQEREMNVQTRLMAEKDRQLAEQAQDAAERLREFNRTLDQKVHERTAEVNDQKSALVKAHAQVEEQAQRLEAQAKELMEINTLKTRFFTNISHELRTPLTLILGPLQDAIEAPETQQDLPIEIMMRNATRLLDLINQLLDVSKLEAGKTDLKLVGLDLVYFVKVRVHSFSSLAESRGLQLGFHADTQQAAVCVDTDKLEKVLYNLLSNAIKFTGEHGKIMVSLSTQQPDVIIIEVRDTGVGISRDQLPYVFDRFYQGREPGADRPASTGVGLAYSRELMRLHGGDISVQSEEDFGSVFTLKLPWRKPDKPLEQELEPKLIPLQSVWLDETQQSEPSFEKTGDQPGIVIIEDNVDISQYMRQNLESAYQVIIAENGMAGLEAVHKHRPDLVICDVMMPDMDGFEVCHQIKNDPAFAHIPVMLVTAKTSVESKTTGWEMGADAYLVKPFTINELLALTANLIGSRKELKGKQITRTILNPSEITANSADEAFLVQLNTLVEANFADASFGVYEMAEEMGLSRRQLLRKLTQISGSGPADYLREFRLRRAAQLLKLKTGNVSEVAYAVGFKNPAHFAARFRETFDLTPSDYIKAEEKPR